MPVKPGPGAVSSNISELYHANADRPAGKKRKRAQIIAIAMAEKRRTAGGKATSAARDVLGMD